MIKKQIAAEEFPLWTLSMLCGGRFGRSSICLLACNVSLQANGKLQLMIDIKMQFILFLNLQILFFHHSLRFGENKAIIDMGEVDHSQDGTKEADDNRRSGSRSTIRRTKTDSIKILLDHGFKVNQTSSSEDEEEAELFERVPMTK